MERIVNPLDPTDRAFYPRRLRTAAVPGHVEYDGPAGTRTRKAFPDIQSGTARRFYVTQSTAGKNPRLVKS